MEKINYEPLDLWRKREGLTWTELAEVGGILRTSLSRIINQGSLLPTPVIQHWKINFCWDGEELAYYCFNGQKPENGAKLIKEVLPEFAKDIADLTEKFASLCAQM